MKENKTGYTDEKASDASNETSLMTTREAASVKKETICPPREMESHSITETLVFLEKKSFWKRNRCNVYAENLFRRGKFGNGPSAKRV